MNRRELVVVNVVLLDEEYLQHLYYRDLGLFPLEYLHHITGCCVGFLESLSSIFCKEKRLSTDIIAKFERHAIGHYLAAD